MDVPRASKLLDPLAAVENGPAYKQKSAAVQEAKTQEGAIHAKLKRIGHDIPKYTFLELIGKGAYGRVFKCHDQVNNRVVALKVIDVDTTDYNSNARAKDDTIDVTIHEIKVLKQLKDSKAKNVNTFFDAFQIHSQLWIVNDYCPGGSVHTLMRATQHRLEEKYILPIARELAAGLRAVHEAGIIHRDVKSANVMIHENGSLQIIDFGVAGTLQTKLDKRNTIIGTPHWMPPELHKNAPPEGLHYGTEVDVWAFGCTLIECATGQPPNARMEPGRRLGATIGRAPPRLVDGNYSEGLRNLVAFVLEAKPSDRPSMEQVLQDPYLHETEITHPTTSLAELVKIYYRWEISGGQRQSLFFPGGAAPAEYPKTLTDEEEWNFSTTAGFDQQIASENQPPSPIEATTTASKTTSTAKSSTAPKSSPIKYNKTTPSSTPLKAPKEWLTEHHLESPDQALCPENAFTPSSIVNRQPHTPQRTPRLSRKMSDYISPESQRDLMDNTLPPEQFGTKERKRSLKDMVATDYQQWYEQSKQKNALSEASQSLLRPKEHGRKERRVVGDKHTVRGVVGEQEELQFSQEVATESLSPEEQKEQFRKDERVRRGQKAMKGIFNESSPEYEYQVKDDFEREMEREYALKNKQGRLPRTGSDLPLRSAWNEPSVHQELEINVGDLQNDPFDIPNIDLANVNTIKAKKMGRFSREEEGKGARIYEEKRATRDWKFPSLEVTDAGMSSVVDKRATREWTFLQNMPVTSAPSRPLLQHATTAPTGGNPHHQSVAMLDLDELYESSDSFFRAPAPTTPYDGMASPAFSAEGTPSHLSYDNTAASSRPASDDGVEEPAAGHAYGEGEGREGRWGSEGLRAVEEASSGGEEVEEGGEDEEEVDEFGIPSSSAFFNLQPPSAESMAPDAPVEVLQAETTRLLGLFARGCGEMGQIFEALAEGFGSGDEEEEEGEGYEEEEEEEE